MNLHTAQQLGMELRHAANRNERDSQMIQRAITLGSYENIPILIACQRADLEEIAAMAAQMEAAKRLSIERQIENEMRQQAARLVQVI